MRKSSQKNDNQKEKSSKKIRVTLDLSQEFYKRLEKLEDKVEAESKAQVIREALRLYEYIIHRYIDGDEFFTRTKSGEEKNIILLGTSTGPID